MSENNSLNLEETSTIDSVEKYKFEPIKGYPMLNWHGKRPFESTQYYPAQKKEVYGEEVNGWINKIFWGDNLQVMSYLLKQYRGKVDLIYIDPPFDSKADYKKNIKLKSKAISNDHNSFEEKQYTDLWTNDEYLQFMYERFLLLRELLAETGSIFIHCDWHQSHYLRCILDELFGAKAFTNEVIWQRGNPRVNASGHFSHNTDTILFYKKSENSKFQTIYTPLDDKYLNKYYSKVCDLTGKRFMPSPLIGHVGTNKEYDWKGFTRAWRYPKHRLDELNSTGRIYWPEGGMGVPRFKKYIDETKGRAVQNLWTDINGVNSQAKEDTTYPTQKPVALIERIIEATTDKGDLVFDCFMGSGTTQVAALNTGRRFIGADINLGSVQTTTKRLLSRIKELKNSVDLKNKPTHSSFEVYNVNNYDVFRNPVEAKRLLLSALEIEEMSSSIYDGQKNGSMVKIMPINRIATREDLNELLSNFPYKVFEQRQEAIPNKPVESIMLICMGHEPDLKSHLEHECGYKLNVEVVDILRDKANIEFKRDSEAELSTSNGKLEVVSFFPMNLLQKLSLQKESVNEWRELVESIVIDWNYGGAAMEPTVIDIPAKDEFVAGAYDIPDDAGTIKIKITDLLSESYEEVIQHG